MKVSYNWLKDYLDIDLDYQKVAEILTDTGLEIEGIEHYESVKGGMKGLVIGQVKTCAAHPNADKLSVTTVDIGGGKILPIVCGAPNVAAGQKVVVATVGTTLYKDDQGFEIKKAKIRGETSEGMICAEDEIGLGDDHEGIVVLPPQVETGTPAKDHFKIKTDVVFEIGITPNRIDGASHIGTARDLAAYLSQFQQVQLKKPSVENFQIDNNELYIPVEIENTKACKRYSAITLSEIEVKPSPEWLQNRLKAIGQKPINNVVDITNFVLHETGHPLHAFDADKIQGKKVIVKTLPQDTTFVTLDDQERKLHSDDLMICNASEGMCIAGVFGGASSGVTQQTRNVFLESAYFDPVYVRKTAKRHGLSTDASFHFERGADPNITIFALKRAALLIKELAGGSIASEIVDVYPEKIQPFEVEIAFSNVDRLIGKHIEKQRIENILKSLDIQIVSHHENGMKLSVPPYRVDVQREADVIEEILRIYGYNNVQIPEQVKSTLSYSPKPNEEKLRNTISDFFSARGFNEIMCNSLTKLAYYQGLEQYREANTVPILNPISSDLNALRQSLLFGGLEVVANNAKYKNFDLKLYEFGNCYFKKNEKSTVPGGTNKVKNYFERQHLGLFFAGNQNPPNWNTPQKKVDLFFAKAQVENLFERLDFNIDHFSVSETQNELLEYGLLYQYQGKTLAEVGLVKHTLRKAFDLDFEIFYADMLWDELLQCLPETPTFAELPKYPKVRRDLALLLDRNITYQQIRQLALKTEKKLLKKVELFDVYEGKNIPDGKKSYAVSFILQDENKTLKDKQIEKVMKKLMGSFQHQLGAKIR